MILLKSYRLVTVFLSVLFLTTIFYSCQKEGIDSKETNQIQELATIQWQGESITGVKIENGVLVGDQILINDEVSGYEAKSVGIIDRLWPNNTVHYSIANNLPNKSRVTEAITYWESKTNLRFVKRTNQKAYVDIVTADNGCTANVGRLGKRQVINLSKECNLGAVIHEIGHAIGLLHEQARADRDKYITINYENIKDDFVYTFNTFKQRKLNGKDLTSSLDFRSIMMYSSYAFSKNGKPTIIKKNGDTYTTNRNVLSDNDIKGIAVLYPKKVTGGSGNTGGPTGYKFAANESDVVKVSGKANVAYGANGKFKFLKNVSKNLQCTNKIFGDPIKGVVKKCYIQIISTTNPTPPTTGVICKGVPAYSPNINYKNGDRFVRSNKLYAIQNNKRKYLERCN